MKTTAFVSHEDCARHDTGWNHPDHQGRMPAIARAVYRDMLTLFDPLLELSATPATLEDLRLVHEAEYLDRLRETAERAAREGAVLELDGVPVSGSSWEAVLAAAGGALTAAEAVLRGDVRNAFVLARPPGRDAAPARAARASLVNSVAVAARHLRERRGVERVAVLAWGVDPPTALASCLAGDDGIVLASVQQTPYAEPAPLEVPGVRAAHGLPRGSDAAAFGAAMLRVLAEVGEVDLLLLSAGFEVLTGDPLGGLAVEPDAVHGLTVSLRGWAEANAGGRVVSVLEGGYAAGPTGRAVVQHLRALAGLPPA